LRSSSAFQGIAQEFGQHRIEVTTSFSIRVNEVENKGA
jgi:hypothetical protein